MRDITLLSGGIGGAELARGLVHGISRSTIPGLTPKTRVTVVATTSRDLWAHGLKVSPDLDAVMYALGDGPSPQAGSATRTVRSELLAYGVEPTWIEWSDREVANHLVRTQMLEAGYGLAQVTEALCRRWSPGARLLPVTEDRVEAHISVVDAASPSGRTVVHVQEYAARLGGEVAAEAVHLIGLDRSSPAPGVLEAITEADLVLLAPSDPVASLGGVLGVPGVREALRTTDAAVVGISPVVAGTCGDPVTGRMLAAAEIGSSAAAVGRHLGARRTGGLLDGWLIDPADGADRAGLEVAGLDVTTVPLDLSGGDADHTVQAVRAITLAALDLARARHRG